MRAGKCALLCLRDTATWAAPTEAERCCWIGCVGRGRLELEYEGDVLQVWMLRHLARVCIPRSETRRTDATLRRREGLGQADALPVCVHHLGRVGWLGHDGELQRLRTSTQDGPRTRTCDQTCSLPPPLCSFGAHTRATNKIGRLAEANSLEGNDFVQVPKRHLLCS